MNYGVTLTGAGPMAEPEKLRRAARKADHLGFHSLWLWDHITFPAQLPASYGMPFSPETPFLGTIPMLAYLAAETGQIRVGSGVLLVALRHPLQVAKDMATLDVVSGGRAMMGVGLGWLAEEYQALGIPFGERVGRVRECVEIVRKIWTAGKLEHRGRYYQFSESTSYPLPVQPGGPPIWFGGTAEPAIKRAAELADGWLGMLAPLEVAIKRVRKAAEFARQAGKADFTVATGASPEITLDEVEQLRQAGANHLNLSFTSGDADEIERRLVAAARRLLG